MGKDKGANVAIVSLSELTANKGILSAKFYVEQRAGRNPYVLKGGELIAWDGNGSLSADALYFSKEEFLDVSAVLMLAKKTSDKLKRLTDKISLQIKMSK